jgi:hypothetical protein
VIEAIRQALQQAIDDKFINLPNLRISIDSIEEPLSSDSIQSCLAALKNQRCVLIIFFDQFEELFTKESLSSAFEALKRVAFLVESLQSNLILGFSWRTGISFSEDHPAYHMWHSLQDKRAEFKVGLFTNRERLEMLATLENNLGGWRLENTLRRHLSEQAQGFPWLLKKLSIHVYRQLSRGVSQRELVESRLEAAVLFEEDTGNLSPNQLSCLKYIAEHSPADLAAVHDLYNSDVVNYLYGSRLIVKSGHKYSVYWDIFREYLISGYVPPIPMTFFPQASLSTLLSILSYIIEEAPVSVGDIEKDFNYKNRHVLNIIGDLSAFFLIQRKGTDELEVENEAIKHAHDLEKAVADYVKVQLERHIVFLAFSEAVKTKTSVSLSELESLVAEYYPSTSPKSLHAYMNRILSWLRFAGLVDLEHPEYLTRPKDTGKDKGKVTIRHPRLIDGKATFLCLSSPTRVIDLATQLCRKGMLSRREVLDNSDRNAAQELTSLGLAAWKKGTLRPDGELNELVKNPSESIKSQCANIIKKSALSAKFLKSLAEQMSSVPKRTNAEIADIISKEFKRDWQPSSAERYLDGGMRWLQYFGELQKLQGQISLGEEWQ